jgi:bifunctional DNA-binding transcriptional regulator/antitoxin component of YhaV-PrlF toxin-antitoxin module
MVNKNEVVKSRKTLMIVIPAPYRVRGKLQPGDRREAESEAREHIQEFQAIIKDTGHRLSPVRRLFAKPSIRS